MGLCQRGPSFSLILIYKIYKNKYNTNTYDGRDFVVLRTPVVRSPDYKGFEGGEGLRQAATSMAGGTSSAGGDFEVRRRRF